MTPLTEKLKRKLEFERKNVNKNIPFKEEDFKSDDFVRIKMPARYFRDLKQALKDLEIE